MDPNMILARHFADNISNRPTYPISLKEMSAETRAEMIDNFDGPLITSFPSNEHMLAELFAQIAKQITKIANVTKNYLPDVPDDLLRVNIALRLWAGCLDAAKTIAIETRDGPNTPQMRGDNSRYIESVAFNDPIYAAGVEAAFAFKKKRGDTTSFEGVPQGTYIYRLEEH